MVIAIREEQPSDIPAIRDVNQRAFAQEQEANGAAARSGKNAGRCRAGTVPARILDRVLNRARPYPRPTLDAWVGAWEEGSGRITIRRSTTGSALALDGSARWDGANGVVHTGRFSSEAVPNGNRLHVVQGSCAIDLALHGSFILAQDNTGCGGMNVRFSGIWRRTAASR